MMRRETMLTASQPGITAPFFCVKSKSAYFFKAYCVHFRMDAIRFFSCLERILRKAALLTQDFYQLIVVEAITID